jgi:hypothetical protein
MLSLKKFGINYYNIFLILIAFASLVLSIIAFTRKEESFGTSSICACNSGSQMKYGQSCDPGYNCYCSSSTGFSYGKCLS